MLCMENVSKDYTLRKQKVAGLVDASVEIHKGDFVSLVGPSGSGKSTLLLMLGGMLSPTSGRVTLDGHSLYDRSTDERAKLRQQYIGFVFQTFNLVPYLTAAENVQVPMFLAGVSLVRPAAAGRRTAPPRWVRGPHGSQTVRVERRSATAGGACPDAGQ